MAGRQDRGTASASENNTIGFQRFERAERESNFRERYQTFQTLERMEREREYRETNKLLLSLIASEAFDYVGKGYTYNAGGIGEDNTFDCSGLVYRAIKDSGCNPAIKRARAIDYRGHEWSIPIKKEDVMRGDLVHFDNPDGSHHIGIVNSSQLKTMINANDLGVVISEIFSSYWATRFKGYTRPKRM